VKWTYDQNKFYLATDWSDLTKKTTKKQRHIFIKTLLHKSIKHNLIYFDMGPSNIVLYKNNISLIDLESTGSAKKILSQSPDGLYFDDNTSDYGRGLGKFNLPYDAAKRDINLFIFSYLFQCLKIKTDIYINNMKNLKETYNLL
jgi:hypothetical protein